MADLQEALNPEPTAQTLDERHKAAPRIRGADRTQVDPNPPTLEELLPEDHDARLIWELVGQLNLEPLYQNIKAVEGHPGRPAVDPKIQVALWCFATLEGISSARELEKRCYEQDPFKWLRGGVDVNYHTLADFRVSHSAWLAEQAIGVVAALLNEDLVTLNKVGQDGLRVRASAGAGSFRREASLEHHLHEAQTQWERLEQEFREGTLSGTAREQGARRRAARERLERLQQAKQEHQKVRVAREARKKGDGEQARASTTDPEARRMKMPDEGYRPAFNVQFATDLDSLMVVGVEVTNAGNDSGQMSPMVQQIDENLGKVPEEHYTDGGFASNEDIEKVSAQGATVYSPVKAAKRRQKEGQDPYAPQPGDSEVVAAWRARMGSCEGQTKYKQRGKCEWTNAWARNRGWYRSLVRGIQKVKAVAWWYALVQNLTRAVALRAGATV